MLHVRGSSSFPALDSASAQRHAATVGAPTPQGIGRTTHIGGHRYPSWPPQAEPHAPRAAHSPRSAPLHPASQAGTAAARTLGRLTDTVTSGQRASRGGPRLWCCREFLSGGGMGCTGPTRGGPRGSAQSLSGCYGAVTAHVPRRRVSANVSVFVPGSVTPFVAVAAIPAPKASDWPSVPVA